MPANGQDPGRCATHHEVTVFVASDPTEAAMIQGLLEEQGIACLSRVEGLGGETAFFSARWAPVPGQSYEIVVSSAAEEAARRLLEETLGPELRPLEPPLPEPSGSGALPQDHKSGGPPPGGPWLLVLLLVLGAIFLAGAITTLLRFLR